MNGDEEKYSPFTPTLSKAPFTRPRKPAAGVVSSRYEEYSGGCGTMVSVRMSLHRAALLSRAGRSLGRRRPASVPRRLRPKLIATHFLAKRSPGPAASRIPTLLCHSEQGYRCFAALNMTVGAALRKEANDKRSAVKNLSTYTFIQILRRSAPQNDKTGRMRSA